MDDNNKLTGFMVLSFIMFGIVMGSFSTAIILQYMGDFNKDTIQDVYLSCSSVYGEKDYKSINMTRFLDTVSKNCGSIFFTKYTGESDYKLALNVCNTDGYCKFTRKDLSCIYEGG